MGQIQMSVYGAIAALVLYYGYLRVKALLDGSKFRKAHGCVLAKQLPQYERVIGLDVFLLRLQDGKNENMLPRGIERYQKLGHTYRCTVIGREVISTIDPENLKALLATQFEDFELGERLALWAPLAGAGIFTTDGAYWEHSREMIRPNFARAQVADLDTFETHIQALIARIPVGETVDLQPLFFRLTLDSSTEFLLGESVHSLSIGDLPQEQDFGYQFNYAQSGLATRTRLGPFYWMHRDAKFDYACKFCHDVVDRFVYSAREKRRTEATETGDVKLKLDSNEMASQYVFINELAKQTDDPIALRNEAMNILIAGRDTTASLLSNLFVILAKHPNVWTKLRTEVLELNGRIPNYETLRNMKYLRYVLNEALRLYPSVPANYRIANKNTTLPHGGGADGLTPVFVPKGAIIGYAIYAMHRRQEIYGPDADEFRPERWDSPKLRPGWGYLPFNGGPRICLGQQFALTEAGYATVRLMQTFAGIEDREPRPWAPKQHLTMSSLWGTKVALRRE